MIERACSCQAILNILLLDDMQQPFSLLVDDNGGSVSVSFATPQDSLHNPKMFAS
jgi:hypothetical protein